MKKLLLIIPALLFSMLGFSQGIEFEHGTWKEVLAKAQQTNKPIFVDVYTTWCGPCKMMDKDIFPLETVGKAYNAGFVCYHLDAEKGEGIEVAKNTKSGPTRPIFLSKLMAPFSLDRWGQWRPRPFLKYQRLHYPNLKILNLCQFGKKSILIRKMIQNFCWIIWLSVQSWDCRMPHFLMTT